MQSLKTVMESTLQNMMMKDSNEQPLKENEYIGEDGLYYCKSCNTLSRTKDIVPLFNKRMPVPCKCELDKQKEEEERKIRYEKQRRIERLKQRSLIDDRYRNKRFTDVEMTSNSFITAYNRCKKYCEIAGEVFEKGYGIYLWGNSGTGKTLLTSCMANELMEKEYTVLFTNFFEILKAIRGTYSNSSNETDDSIINNIAEVDFLFIDDLGTESLSKNAGDNFTQDKIFEIINKRYNKKKPTIFSSNYPIKSLTGDRNFMGKTVDRIYEMSSAIIKIEGESYRVKKQNDVIPF